MRKKSETKAQKGSNSVSVNAGLIAVAETTRSGLRPERTVYQITPQGTKEGIRWLRELLERPATDSTWFFAALSFLPALDPQDAREQLQKRVGHLEAEIDSYQQVLANLTSKIGRLSLIELEYALALRTADLEWTTQIIKELRSGTLKWDSDVLCKHAAHWFEAWLPHGAF